MPTISLLDLVHWQLSEFLLVLGPLVATFPLLRLRSLNRLQAAAIIDAMTVEWKWTKSVQLQIPMLVV